MSDTPKADPSIAYENLRRESAALLDLDPAGDLTALQQMQIDLAAIIRMEIDSAQGQQLAGNEIDIGRLSVAVTMLGKLLPQRALEAEAPKPDFPYDARAALAALIEGQVAANEVTEATRVQELEREVSDLRELLARSRAGAAPSAPAVTYVDAGAGDGPSPAPAPMGMDDPLERAKRAESERIRAIASRPRLEEWRPYVGGGYSTGFGIHSIPKDF
jgi:hypothetical protein